MNRFAFAPLVLLLACYTPAQPPAPTPTPPTPPAPAKAALGIPDEIKPIGDYATYSPDSATTCKAVTYIGMSGVSPFPSALLADKRAFVLPTRGLTPGPYKFTAVGSLNDEHVVKEFIVTVAGVTPPPQPPAPPQPPGPQPVAEPLWLIVVEETSQRTPAIGALLGDLAFWQGLTPHKFQFEDKDINSPQVQSHVAAAQAANVALPALVMMGQTSHKVFKVVPLPSSTDGVRAAVKAVTQ